VADTNTHEAQQLALKSALYDAFKDHFGAPPPVTVQAPGRVNLIGEHTDYNDGFVLPCAIDFGTLVAASPRKDRLVRVLALDQGAALDEFSLDAPITPRIDASWPNYVRGMVQALLQAGWPLTGADLAISGNVPLGAGLSSSAALEVSVGQAFKELCGLHALDPTQLALLAQRAENDFVGCRCGIMDQLISARGQAGHALLIDCRSLKTRPVEMPDDMVILIVHSNVQRGLVDGEYNLRRQQCETAARHYGVAALRDLKMPQLLAGAAGLDATVLRRARHIVTENARTLAAAEALEEGDLHALGSLMAESHVSMRDDFEITTPAIDHLVQIIGGAIDGQGGVRMTGGGFGGCVVALTTQQGAERAMARVAVEYRSPQGLAGKAYLCQAAAGARLLERI
jgi:galactokinase